MEPRRAGAQSLEGIAEPVHPSSPTNETQTRRTSFNTVLQFQPTRVLTIFIYVSDMYVFLRSSLFKCFSCVEVQVRRVLSQSVGSGLIFFNQLNLKLKKLIKRDNFWSLFYLCFLSLDPPAEKRQWVSNNCAVRECVMKIKDLADMHVHVKPLGHPDSENSRGFRF